MAVRPPKTLRSRARLDPIAAALDQEVLAEKAATYGRLVRRLERALAALAAFDAEHSARDKTTPRGAEGGTPDRDAPRGAEGGMPDRDARRGAEGGTLDRDVRRGAEERSSDREEKRAALVSAAGRALWYVVIQRDLCGFGGTPRFLNEMGVPAEVRLRMGVVGTRR